MSEYIPAGEYSQYGLPGTTTEENVQAASALIDGFLRRPEGLVWSPDAAGQPCFMTGAAAMRIWKPVAAISPGASVVVTLPSVPPASMLGEAMVLDSATPAKCETAVVIAIDGANITLDNLTNGHNALAPISAGLVISERRNVGYQGPVAFLSRTPVVRIVSVGSRWDRSNLREPALSESRHGVFFDYAEGIGPIPAFGTPPQWTLLDPTLVDFDIATGKLDVRIFGSRNEVRACYLAGWDQDDLPDAIKQVCARLVLSIQSQDQDIPSNVKLYRAGDTAIQKFADSVLDDDMKFQLLPFKVLTGI